MSDIKYTVLEITPDHVIVAFKTQDGEWRIGQFLRAFSEMRDGTKIQLTRLGDA